MYSQIVDVTPELLLHKHIVADLWILPVFI